MAKTVLNDLIDRFKIIIASEELTELYRAGLMVSVRRMKCDLEEEKQQIMDAWIAGREFGCKHDDPKTAEEYYNRTYKSE